MPQPDGPGIVERHVNTNPCLSMQCNPWQQAQAAFQGMLGMVGEAGKNFTLTVGSFLPFGRSAQAVELVTMYRAVGPAELASISATKSFTSAAGLEGKYFTTSALDAASYARQAVKAFGDPAYTIVSTRVPQSVLNLPGITATVDRGIPAYVIPNQQLPGLIPTIFKYSPIR